ncbi:MAG: Ig-like domain-containing protein, partial [Solirubrobacteraceae bacterium]
MTIVSAMSAATAGAVPPPFGGLTQRAGAAGCITEFTLASCATKDVLFAPTRVTVTPDGRQVLIVDHNNIITFNRNAHGALTYARCLSDDGSSGASTPCEKEPLVKGVIELAVSPNGKQVYAVEDGLGMGVLLIFDRDSATGALKLSGCYTENGGVICLAAKGLQHPASVAVSHDGNAVAVGGENAVTVFARNPQTGKLSDEGCISSSDLDCTAGNSDYGDVEAVAFAPDDRAVYGTARSGDAIEVVRYNPATHLVAPLQCLTGSSPTTGCVTSNPAGYPDTVTVGTTVPFVYTSSFNRSAVATWRRAPDDRLSFVSCRSFTGDVDPATGVCTKDYRLQQVYQVLVSQDGTRLYTVADRGNPDQGSQDVAVYARSPNGAPTPLRDPYSCWAEADEGPEGGCKPARALNDPAWAALPPSGAQLYVAVYSASPGGAALDTFDREVGPSCAASSATTRSGVKVSVKLSCTDLNGDPLKLSIVRGPLHGKLGPITGRRTTYTSSPTFTGIDHFTFRASDGRLRSTPAVATIKVTAPPAVAVAIRSHQSTVSHGKAPIRLACSGPAGRTCAGTLTFLRSGSKQRQLGSAGFSIPAGGHGTVQVLLSRAAKALLAKHSSIVVVAQARFHPRPGQSSVTRS